MAANKAAGVSLTAGNGVTSVTTTTVTQRTPDGKVTISSSVESTGGEDVVADAAPQALGSGKILGDFDVENISDIGMFADKEGQLKVFLEDGSELTLSGLPPPLKANNYDVPSTVPPDDPIKRVDMMNLEEILARVADLDAGEYKFCRCWKSKNFPMCDGSHDEHNAETGDNAGPVVLTKGLPAEARGLDKIAKLAGPPGEPADANYANHYAVPSNMPPGEPTKRVEIIDIEDIKEHVLATGEVKFCRCWKSAEFPFCDGSHDGHNLACGDNTGPVVITPGAKQ